MGALQNLLRHAEFPEAVLLLEPRLKPLPSLESLYSFHVEQDMLEGGRPRYRARYGLQRRIARTEQELSKKPGWESGAIRVYLKLCQGAEHEARLLAASLCQQFPNEAVLWLLKAAALWTCVDMRKEHAQRVHLAEARRSIQRALSLDPSSEKAVLLRAHIWRGLEDNEAAVRDFKSLVKKNPLDWHLRMLLVEALLEIKNLGGALTHLRRVRRQRGNTWWVLAQLGHAHGLKGNLAPALRYFNQAIRLNPGMGSLHAWKAEVLRKMGRYQESLKTLNAAVRLAPAYIFTRVCRGRLHLMLGQNAKALKDLEAASRLCPADRLCFAWKAEALAKLGRWREAWAAYDHVMPLNPESMWNAQVQEGKKLSAKQKRKAFWNFWADSVQKAPHNPYPRLLLGRFLMITGKNWAAALENLSKAHALAQDAGTRAHALAWRGLFIPSGAAGPRLEDLKRACTLDGRPLYLSWKGTALARHGRTQEAMAIWKKALKHPHPNLAPAFVERGKFLWDSGRHSEALRDFEMGFCMDSSLPSAREWLRKAEGSFSQKI